MTLGKHSVSQLQSKLRTWRIALFSQPFDGLWNGSQDQGLVQCKSIEHRIAYRQIHNFPNALRGGLRNFCCHSQKYRYEEKDLQGRNWKRIRVRIVFAKNTQQKDKTIVGHHHVFPIIFNCLMRRVILFVPACHGKNPVLIASSSFGHFPLLQNCRSGGFHKT